jgi:hypothetical protein
MAQCNINGSGSDNATMQGAALGSTFGPWGAVIGAGLGATSSYLSGRSKKKALKKKKKMMQDALRRYQAGSTDAYGNKLSSSSDGNWNYDLNLASQQARNAANRAMIDSANYVPKSASQIRNETLANNLLANNLTARANQSAAMRTGLRTGSNLGNIAAGFSRQGAQNLRNAYQQGLQNANNTANINARTRRDLSSAASSAMKPITNIQSNLQNMVNGLNKTVMSQENNIANVAGNPYLYGQEYADVIGSLGQSAPEVSDSFDQATVDNANRSLYDMYNDHNKEFSDYDLYRLENLLELLRNVR